MRQDWEETLEMGAFAVAPSGLGQGMARAGQHRSISCRRDLEGRRELEAAQAGPCAPALATDQATGRAVLVGPSETLLQAIERDNPRSATVGCRNGGCGVCRVQLLSGKVRLGKMSRRFVTVDMERERFALACRVYPQGDLTFRLAPLDPRAL